MKWSYFKIFQNERSLKSIIEFENVDVICHRWCHYFDKLWVKERDVLGLPCRRNTHEVLTTGHYAAIRLYSASQWNLQYNVTNEPNFVLRANLSKRTAFRKTDCFFQNAAAHVRKSSPFSEKQSVWSGYITNEFVVITWACGGARWNLTDHGCAWRSVDLSAFVVRIVVKASTSSSFDQNILSIDFVVIWVCVIGRNLLDHGSCSCRRIIALRVFFVLITVKSCSAYLLKFLKALRVFFVLITVKSCSAHLLRVLQARQVHFQRVLCRFWNRTDVRIPRCFTHSGTRSGEMQTLVANCRFAKHCNCTPGTFTTNRDVLYVYYICGNYKTLFVKLVITSVSVETFVHIQRIL